jgi:Mrp family chromosome partitioning ATPase
MEISGVPGALQQERATERARENDSSLLDRSLPVSDDALQSAARLKLVLGSGGCLVALSQLEERGGSGVLALRLALALSRLDQSPVLIVDGDSRSSMLAEKFEFPSFPGLWDVLQGTVDLPVAVRRIEPAGNLFLLPVGSCSSALAYLLASDAARQLMARLRERYRYTIINVGAIRKQPDGMLLASLADGVVLAVAAGHSRHELVEFREELSRLKVSLFGAIITK